MKHLQVWIGKSECLSNSKKLIPSENVSVDLWIISSHQKNIHFKFSHLFPAWLWSSPWFLNSFPFFQMKRTAKKQTKSNPTRRQKGCLYLKPLLSKGLQVFCTILFTTQDFVFCQKVLGPEICVF